MTRSNNRQQFLDRLTKRIDCLSKILDVAVSVSLINQDKKDTILKEHPGTQTLNLYCILQDMEKHSSIQMVSYTWSVLPNEYMELSIVTLHDIYTFEWEE